MNKTGFDSSSFSLLGDSSNFPFDLHYVNFILLIPLQDIKFYNIGKYDQSVNSSWVSTISAVPLNIDEIKTLSANIDCRIPINNASFLCHLRQTDFIDINNSSFLNFHINFQRNYTADVIKFPILAIFFLLGAIFILDSTLDRDQLAIRIAITLSIFAFLFTFTPLVNQMKPIPVSNVPTLGDFLITFILFATIVFTVSSVISSSPITHTFLSYFFNLIFCELRIDYVNYFVA